MHASHYVIASDVASKIFEACDAGASTLTLNTAQAKSAALVLRAVTVHRARFEASAEMLRVLKLVKNYCPEFPFNHDLAHALRMAKEST